MTEQQAVRSTVRKSRSKNRQPVVPLPGPWRNSSWVSSFGGKGASPLKYNEVSPSFILRQLLVLIEKAKFVDASQLLNKISIDSLKEVITDIPIDNIIESVPQSLVVLESLYSRLFLSDMEQFPVEQFQVEAMVFHIVRYISMVQSSMEFKYPKPADARKSIINILRVVLHVNSDLVRTLFKRKKLMETALQGIGEHGLIQMNGSLINLHDALKFEIGKTIQAYKGAVNTLEHLNLSHSKPLKLQIHSDKKSSHGNHQALTKLNENQIKNRLYKNKSLLNAIELRVNAQLPALIQTLKDRIEYDKSALLAFGKLKTEIKSFSSHTKVVPLIAQYSNSLQTVLDIFKELLDEHCGSDQSSYSTLGYHSDEEDMISLNKEDEDEESSIKEAIVMETEAQPEMAATVPKEGPSIDQILEPTLNHHEKPSNPDLQPKEQRSRWWKHHKRSNSLELAPTMRQTLSGSSSSINELGKKQRLRSSSVDRINISRPRKESVDESEELQQMLTRIRKMSASSPAVGRRQLEKRGISQPRSRDSSVSPAVLRRHFFGGGEQTPSINSQTDDIKDEDPDPLYAKLKFKSPPPQSTVKDLTNDDKTKSSDPDPLYATVKFKGQGAKGATKDGATSLPDLEELEPHQLAKIEEKLTLENERLIRELQRVATEMQKLKDAQKKVASRKVSTPDPKKDIPPIVVIQQSASSTNEAPPLDLDKPESKKNRCSSPSFVEQQVAVLEKQRDENMSLNVNNKSQWQLEDGMSQELSVQQRRISFERQLMPPSDDDVVPTTSDSKSSVEVEERSVTERSVTEKSVTIVDSLAMQQKADAENEIKEPKVSIKEIQSVQLNGVKPISPAQQESPAGESDSKSQQDSSEKPPAGKQPEAVPPTHQNQIVPAQGKVPTTNGPSTGTIQKQESPVQQRSDVKVKPMVPKKVQMQAPSTTEDQASALPALFQPAAVEQESSPAIQRKSASLIKQKGMGSQQRSHKTSTKQAAKPTHTNRHLPKNHIRHITGDLLYEYDKLYSEQRAIAWTGLTINPQDKDVILFSVIVFAFRSAQITIHELHMAKARMQQLPMDDEESVSSYTIDIPPDNKSQVELLQHLRKMGINFDLSPMIADVLEQVYEISEEHLLLEASAPLKKFAKSCVSLAWRLSIQSSPYVIDFELRSFDPAVHQRTLSSSRRSSRIKEHIWPSLIESSRGMCVYKGVVLT